MNPVWLSVFLPALGACLIYASSGIGPTTCVSFPHFLGKVSSPPWSRSCPLSTPAPLLNLPTKCFSPHSSPTQGALTMEGDPVWTGILSFSWTSVPASGAGPGCSIMCRMGLAWTPWKGTGDSSFGHLCPWKACNGELGDEGTKSEPVPLQPTCQESPGHSFLLPPPIPAASLCLALLTATSCPRVCGEQSRGIPGPESEEVPQQAGRMQEYAYARRCSKFQFPQPCAEPTKWGQDGWVLPWSGGWGGT